MKKETVVFLMLALVLCVQCGSKNPAQSSGSGLEGRWRVVSVSDPNADFSPGQGFSIIYDLQGGGTLVITWSGPGGTLTFRGTWSVTGSRLSLAWIDPDGDRGSSGGTYTLVGNRLTILDDEGATVVMARA